MGDDATSKDERHLVFYCGNLRAWLESLVHRHKLRRCTYEVCDDPSKWLLGMMDARTGASYMLPVYKANDRKLWKIELPSNFVKMLKTPEGREKLAWVLSVGDHCLEF